MTDPAIRPPFASPSGPRQSDDAVAAAFCRGARSGFSPRLHIEGDVLVMDRMVPVALRIGEAAVLVRVDQRPPVDVGPQLQLVDADPLLATAVALEVLGLPASRWHLKGNDAEGAADALMGIIEGLARPSFDT